jgi:hypothetical protein
MTLYALGRRRKWFTGAVEIRCVPPGYWRLFHWPRWRIVCICLGLFAEWKAVVARELQGNFKCRF